MEMEPERFQNVCRHRRVNRRTNCHRRFEVPFKTLWKRKGASVFDGLLCCISNMTARWKISSCKFLQSGNASAKCVEGWDCPGPSHKGSLKLQTTNLQHSDCTPFNLASLIFDLKPVLTPACVLWRRCGGETVRSELKRFSLWQNRLERPEREVGSEQVLRPASPAALTTMTQQRWAEHATSLGEKQSQTSSGRLMNVTQPAARGRIWAQNLQKEKRRKTSWLKLIRLRPLLSSTRFL